MKKMLSLTLSVAMVFVIFNIFVSTPVSAAIKLDTTNVSIGIGSNGFISLTGAKGSPTWSCSNNNVVSIDSYGYGHDSTTVVRGLKKGTAKVTATYSGKKYTCTVTVTPQHVSASTVYLQQGKLYNIKSSSSYYKKDKIYDLYSSDKSIAEGFKTGNIKGKKAGTTRITYYFQSGYTNFMYDIDVVVLPKTTVMPTFNQTHSTIGTISNFSEISLDKKTFSTKITGLSENKPYKVYYRNVKASGTSSTTSTIKSTTITTNSKIQKTAITKGTYKDYSNGLLSYSTYGTIDDLYYYVKDKNFFSVAVIDKNLHINKYDSNLKYISSKKVSLSYPLFGGFYDAPDGNFYVATGQTNNENTQGNRVSYCVTKYDTNWNLLDRGTISADNARTVTPYNAGTASMALSGNTLVLHAARLRYASSDGVNHQSNFTATFDTNTMNVAYTASDFPFNHVSHSFQSFVKTDGDNLVFVDHGDAYPRSIYMQTYPQFLLYPLFSSDTAYGTNLIAQDLMEIEGYTGNNYTGSNVSGFETGLNGNIVVGNSVPHYNAIKEITGSSSNFIRNIYLSVANKSGEKNTFKWLTNYIPDGKISTSIPRLVKINDDKFVIMFVTYLTDENNFASQISGRNLIAITINSNGDVLDKKTYSAYFSSNTQPIYFNNKIIWYENNPLSSSSNISNKGFYSINP